MDAGLLAEIMRRDVEFIETDYSTVTRYGQACTDRRVLLKALVEAHERNEFLHDRLRGGSKEQSSVKVSWDELMQLLRSMYPEYPWILIALRDCEWAAYYGRPWSLLRAGDSLRFIYSSGVDAIPVAVREKI